MQVIEGVDWSQQRGHLDHHNAKKDGQGDDATGNYGGIVIRMRSLKPLRKAAAALRINTSKFNKTMSIKRSLLHF